MNGTRAYFDDGSGNTSGQLGSGYQVRYVSNYPNELNMKEDKEDVSVISNKYIVIDNMFKLEGYEFINWNTKVDGSGTSYKVKDVYLEGKNLLTKMVYRSMRKNIQEKNGKN